MVGLWMNEPSQFCTLAPVCECPKNRFINSPNGQPGHNHLGSGLRRFFAYADPSLCQIAAQVLRNRATHVPRPGI
jgi:sulfatase maturation enzyme AslB (radical SAM superfamily)